MKTLFYEMKDFELDYFLERIPKALEPYFFKIPITKSTYIDSKNKDAQAISVFVGSFLDKDVLSQFKNLKYIFLRAAGYSNIDITYCRQNNIKILNAPNYATSTVAQYAFSLLLALTRKIILAKDELEKGKIEHQKIMGEDINNKTIGIIGLGSIGKKIANISTCFDMKVIYYDIEKNDNYSFVELDELYNKSDFIIVCCPLNEKTMGMINKDAFLKMKREAILINVARGEIINTKDLYEALVKKRIQGAGLDVIECEQKLCNLRDFCLENDMKDNCLKKYLFIRELFKMPNVIITPHNAYNTKEALTRILDMTLENIQTVIQAKELKNLI